MYKIWQILLKRADVFRLFLKGTIIKNTMSKSQVRVGRHLLWQENHSEIDTNWNDCFWSCFGC